MNYENYDHYERPDASALATWLLDELRGVEYRGEPAGGDHGMMRRDCFSLANPATGRSLKVELTENGLAVVELSFFAVPEDPDDMRCFIREIRRILDL